MQKYLVYLGMWLNIQHPFEISLELSHATCSTEQHISILGCGYFAVNIMNAM